MHRIRPFPLLPGVLPALLLVVSLVCVPVWFGGCSAPKKPRGSTSGGWSTYGSETEAARVASLPPQDEVGRELQQRCS